MYGVCETNPLDQEQLPPNARYVDWTTPGLKVTRLRLLSDPGFPFWDVSYCWGILPNKERVRVQLPFSQLDRGVRRNTPFSKGKKVPSIAQQIIEHAKRDNVYAKGLGILDNLSTLV